ncbi:MAG: minichromosome maintenance protein MCM [Candidatus Micrarchaeota archaeon]|nr:MAG: minichromosome maintenance protein MCM [Candidatus Micrarchaeota archaeon]
MIESSSIDILNSLKSFLQQYCSQEIDEIRLEFPNRRSLDVDIALLASYNRELASMLIDNPDSIIREADNALASILNLDKSYRFHVRFYNQNIYRPLVQDVGTEYLEKLITLDALVVKRSEVLSKVRIANVRCTKAGCSYRAEIDLDYDELPEKCPLCNSRIAIQEDHSSKIDMQRIAIQDPLEVLKGNVPNWQLTVVLEDDLVNSVLPGDRIEVTGVLKAAMIDKRRNRSIRSKDIVYAMYLKAVSLIHKQKDFASLQITKSDEEKIKDLAKDPNIIDKIVNSIAASVYGYREIKTAVALQLFGGNSNKSLIDNSPVRSDIHILLIGDPGSAKTRILQSVAALVPKGIYVSGKSVTAGGLTAVAEKDEFSEGGWTLKAGALVLGNGGLVCIDEFDKISDEDRSALHEAMESQTISVAKAGIVANFSAKTSILAAANPKYGRFDPNKYPADQYDIPPTLLSRFDLIFPIRDLMDEQLDRNIAEHITLQHKISAENNGLITDQLYNEQNKVSKPEIDRELLRKYIAYARRNIFPALTEEARGRIVSYYTTLRKLGKNMNTTPITPRQLEGLIRLSEASAKARLSNKVEISDVERAISLLDYVLRQVAIDKEGRIDIDIISTNMPKERVSKINIIKSIISSMEKKEGGAAKIDDVIKAAGEQGISTDEVNRLLLELEKGGEIYKPRVGYIKLVEYRDE